MLKKKKKNRTREEYTKDLLEFHKDFFENVNEKYQFIPKFAFYKKGTTIRDGKVLQFFESELEKPVTIFTELINKNGDYEDPSRTLYKLPHNPFFREEYESVVKSNSKGEEYKIYYIKFEELILINKKETKKINTTLTGDDLKWEDLTARDRICIELKIPYSNKDWLNKLITKVNK